MVRASMAKNAAPRPKRPHLTDADRHKRFVETAIEVGADERAEAFDRVFAQIVVAPVTKS